MYCPPANNSTCGYGTGKALKITVRNLLPHHPVRTLLFVPSALGEEEDTRFNSLTYFLRQAAVLRSLCRRSRSRRRGGRSKPV